jgi:DHA1 family tetracycline resistance protein-like MFS transporter
MSNAADEAGHLFDRRAITLVAVILLTEAAIAIIFFSLVQQYPAYLLRQQGSVHGPGSHLLRNGAVYAGYALSAYGLAKLPGQPLSGWLSDRFGAQRLLLCGLGVCLVVIGIMSAVTDVSVFVWTCALYGLAAAVIWPAVFALVGDAYRASGRGRITAAISGAQVFGTAGGFAGGAVLIDHLGYAAAFVAAASFDALALGFGLLRAFEPPRVAPAVPSASPPREGADFRGTLATLRTTVSADLLMLSAILVLVSLAVSLLAPDLKPYSATVLHIRYSTMALLLAVPAAAAVLTLIPSGIIADSLGRSFPMLISSALWPVSLIAMTFTRSLPIVLIFATIAAFAYALGLPAWSATLIDLSTAGHRGLQVGFVAAVQGAGLAAGPAIGGEIVAHFGSLAPFRLSGAIMLGVFIVTVVYWTRASRSFKVPVGSLPSS